MSFVMPINKLIQAIVARNFTNGLTIVWPWPDQFLFQGLIYPLNDLMVKIHSLISRACCPGLIMVWLWSNWWSFNHGRPWSNWRSFIVSSRSCCSRLTMVDHGQIDGHVVLGWPWSNHGLTMVKLSFYGQFKVMLFWVDHGQIDGHFMVSSRSCFLVWPWSNWWSEQHDLELTIKWQFDHGQTMVDHGQPRTTWPSIWPWSNQKTWPWTDHEMTINLTMVGHFMVSGRSCCPGLTMVDHGQIKVMLFWVDHGRPWSTMVWPWSNWWSFHGQLKVMLSWVDHGQPWFDHGQYVRFDHHWSWYDHDYLTMVDHGHDHRSI